MTSSEQTGSPRFTLPPCPECAQGKHGNCDGTTWDEIGDAPATCPCLTDRHGEKVDQGITYVDHDPRGISGGSLHTVTISDHVHIRTSDRCIKNRHGAPCTPSTTPKASDDELARRLEWATGRNGGTLLGQIRAEGLDVVVVTADPAAVAP